MTHSPAKHSPILKTRNPNLDSVIRNQMGGTHASLSPEALQAADRALAELRASWWTGLAPLRGVCPGVDADGIIHSLPPPHQATCGRAEVKAYFDNTWTITEVLFQSLKSAEAFYIPPYHGLRHPFIFYYVHPAALYVNKLRVAGLLDKPVNPYFEQLFETGVDEMSWDDLSKNEMEWPDLKEAHAYRQDVYRLVSALIASHPDLSEGHRPITLDHPLWALFLGFEHERIHIETSSVLMRELPIDLIERPRAFPLLHPSAAQASAFPPVAGREYPTETRVGSLLTSSRWCPVAKGVVRIGKPRDWPTFGWDNEYGEKTLEVPRFQASRFLISNGEFWEFVSDGGYRESSHWTKTGWQWREFRNVKWPTFWVPDGPQGTFRFKLRTCFEVIDMPWSWPAAVNYHEAKAYANWRSKKDGVTYRLPTEAEHYRLRAEVEPMGERLTYEKWYGTRGDAASAHVALSNFDLRHGSEAPIDEQLRFNPELKVCDVFGNLWQWLEDDFHPLPGFKVHPHYDDFSTPCYDGKHTMMVGGSFISTGDEASYWERYHFRPHFYQHSGFRLVAAEEGSLERLAGRILGADSEHDAAEMRLVLDQQLVHHYGSPESAQPACLQGLSNAAHWTRFPERIAGRTIDWMKKLGISCDRALEVGCSVGGGAFRLSEEFSQVIATDLSASFIEAARALKETGSHPYTLLEEGELTAKGLAQLPPPARPERVEFRQADASSLPAEYVGFDAVVVPNLLDRLPSPKSLLGRLGGPRGVVRPGGLLAIASPFDWSERFTPKEVWLGGFTRDGRAFTSLEGLIESLHEDFELLEEFKAPLIIRERNRRFLFIESAVTVWRRR